MFPHKVKIPHVYLTTFTLLKQLNKQLKLINVKHQPEQVYCFISYYYEQLSPLLDYNTLTVRHAFIYTNDIILFYF
jgi:hypothetical protein